MTTCARRCAGHGGRSTSRRGSVDLVWAEGSIYAVGRERALTHVAPLAPSGRLRRVQRLRLVDRRSFAGSARDYWAAEYPDMASEAAIRSRAEAAGYRAVDGFRLPREAHDAYYVPLEARAAALAGRTEPGVRRVLGDIRREIDIVRRFSGEAGYSFFVLQRAEG